MSFQQLYPSDNTELVQGFPEYLKNAIFLWIKTHVSGHTPRPRVFNTRYTAIDPTFNAKISSSLRLDLGASLEQHLQVISESKEHIAEYVNYLLQKYPDLQSARNLAEVLDSSNSEYKVAFLEIPTKEVQLSPGISVPAGTRKMICLQFRAPEVAYDQMKLLSRYNRIQIAWNDLYDVSHQNLASVVQKSLDELAGALRDKLYPDDERTNLSDYANRIRDNIENLELPDKERVDWVALISSVANYVNTRDVHNSGTDSSPTYENAHIVLHLCIALIVLLGESN